MFYFGPTAKLALFAAQKLPSRSFSTGAGKSIMVPNMGDSITEGTIKSWLRKEGEYAALDEIICEIETDKIVVEFRMPEGGIITKQLANAGSTVQVSASVSVSVYVGVRARRACESLCMHAWAWSMAILMQSAPLR